MNQNEEKKEKKPRFFFLLSIPNPVPACCLLELPFHSGATVAPPPVVTPS